MTTATFVAAVFFYSDWIAIVAAHLDNPQFSPSSKGGSIFRCPAFITVVIAIVGVAAAFFQYFPVIGSEIATDWRYFTSQNLFFQSIILHFHSLPTHVPWTCGGMDYLANPQSRIFSPNVIFDLLLPAQFANLASLLLQAFVGFVGMTVLLRHLGCKWLFAWAGAYIFISSTWFGLHFSEGHIPFGNMQLLPWIWLGALLFPQPKYFPILPVTVGLFFVDGGIYAIVFGMYITLLVLCLFNRKWLDFSRLRHLFASKIFLYSMIGLGLLGASKLYAVLTLHQHRGALTEAVSLSLESVVNTLLLIDTTLFAPAPPESQYRVHEFGCYLGYSGLIAILATIATMRGFWRKISPYFVIVLFGIWIFSNFGDPINPWRLHQIIPLLSQTHVQSRWILLSFLSLALATALGLNTLHSKHPRFALLLALACLVEMSIARWFSIHRLYMDPERSKAIGWGEFITATVPSKIKGISYSPRGFLEKDAFYADCYERAYWERAAHSFDSAEYHGVVYFSQGSGTAEVTNFQPGKLTVRYEASPKSEVTIDTSWHRGWRSETAAATPFRAKDGEVAVAIPGGGIGEFVLIYDASQFWISLFLALLGYIASIKAIMLSRSS